MVAKNTPRPRPNKNSDGLPKQPSYTHTISSVPTPPAKPIPPPPLPPPPGAPAAGAVNPMTHPNHPMMQSSLGGPPPMPPGGPGAPGAPQPPPPPSTQTPPIPQGPPGALHQSQAMPQGGNANPTGNPLGNLTPTPTTDQRQVREQIQFKDMSPVEQAQTAGQQGLDPYAPIKMVQQGVQGAIGQGGSSGAIPNMLSGPYVPPGVENFPDDFAHLSTLMQQGYAPGASGQEHETGQNAHAMMRAKVDAAMQHAQQGVGTEVASPPAPPANQAALTPQDKPQVTLAAGIPNQDNAPPSGYPMGGAAPPAPPAPGGPPSMGSSLGGPPPQQPGAPGGIPPALIAALIARHKQGMR